MQDSSLLAKKKKKKVRQDDERNVMCDGPYDGSEDSLERRNDIQRNSPGTSSVPDRTDTRVSASSRAAMVENSI